MIQPGRKSMPLVVRLLIVSMATFLYVYLSLYLLSPRPTAPMGDEPTSAAETVRSESN